MLNRIQRAYKFRFRPDRQQVFLLRRYFGAKRWVWNACLAWRKNWYETFGESVTGTDFSRELTWLKTLDTYAWLREIPSTVLTQVLRDQDQAFKHFFRRVKQGEKPGYPRFKSRRNPYQSVRLQLDQRRVMNNYRAGVFLRLPGLGVVKLHWSRKPGGVPKMVTVSQDAAGRYFVSMAVDEAIEAKPPTTRTVGIDLGLKDLAITSHGEKIEHPRHLTRRLDSLAKLQRRLARQQKGSGRWQCTGQRIARLHARIGDARQDSLHKLSTRLVSENQVISLESLRIKNLSRSARGTIDNPGKRVRQKAGLNRSIADSAWGELVRQIEYKAQWHGRTVVQIDPFEPSSKKCSKCRHVLDELRLDQREWTCPRCGTRHDRDFNAANNILREGLALLENEQLPGGTGCMHAFGGEGSAEALPKPTHDCASVKATRSDSPGQEPGESE